MPTDDCLLAGIDPSQYSEERLAQIVAARRRRCARAAEADKSWARHSDEWMAENALLHLEEIVTSGLSSVYDGVKSFLYDFFPGFSWRADKAAREIRLVLDNPRFVLVHKHFSEQLGFDLRAELESAAKLRTE